jgi:hypothetical protein
MKLLFEEIASKCFKPANARIRKLKKWVKQTELARKTGNLEPYPNQYDKAEEIITFYTFAPYFLSSKQVDLTNKTLKLAGITDSVDSVVSAGLERLMPPPPGYLAWMQEQIKNHPVRYIREQAASRKNHNKPLEAPTHVDAFIETDNLIIFVEMKFTSDISMQTTFNPYRNQLARLIDVGISLATKKSKKLVLLLCSPSIFFVNKSRFYSYKITEYTDYQEVKKDINWREQNEIEKHVSAVAWIPLESLVQIMYQGFNHPDVEEALEFFRERNLA